ncbi:MAG: AI-2E family transporter [Parachlamydiaceae bacterium]|nr:AI-2E family transporter [Parachlamydiaceae bacterium]
MWYEEKFYKYTIGIILVLLIILLLYLTFPFFAPILWFIAAIFLPVLFSAFLYYVFRPLVNFVERWIPRYLAILVVYLLAVVVVSIIFLIFVPQLIETVTNISPDKIESMNQRFNDILAKLKSYIPISNVPLIENVVVSYLPKINQFLYQLSINMVTTLAGIAISLALTPFVLFFFLRDDSLFAKSVLRFVPPQFISEVESILQDIDSTLSNFILAQLTLAGIIGIFLLIGYMIIGLPHSASLAIFAMIFYVIPFLGTFIAIIPALIVALTISFWMALKVILVMFIAHFIEANILTPRLMSQRLQIHPLTIIFLLLAAGSLYGIFGLLLVTPTYAILKVIVWNIYKIWKLHNNVAKGKASIEEANVEEMK